MSVRANLSQKLLTVWNGEPWYGSSSSAILKGITAAEALGRPGDVGAIAVGRYGDLIAVTGDPIADVSGLQSVAFVMKGGEVVKWSAQHPAQ